MFSSFLSLFIWVCTWVINYCACKHLHVETRDWGYVCVFISLHLVMEKGSLWTAELAILDRLAEYQVLGFICSITQGWDCISVSLGLAFMHPIDPYSNPIHTQLALYLRSHILGPTCSPPLKKYKLGKENWACSPGLKYFPSIQKTLVNLQVSKWTNIKVLSDFPSTFFDLSVRWASGSLEVFAYNQTLDKAVASGPKSMCYGRPIFFSCRNLLWIRSADGKAGLNFAPSLCTFTKF